MNTQKSRWLTGAGAGLTVVTLTFALIAPADALGFVGLLAAVILAIGVAKEW